MTRPVRHLDALSRLRRCPSSTWRRKPQALGRVCGPRWALEVPPQSVRLLLFPIFALPVHDGPTPTPTLAISFHPKLMKSTFGPPLSLLRHPGSPKNPSSTSVSTPMIGIPNPPRELASTSSRRTAMRPRDGVVGVALPWRGSPDRPDLQRPALAPVLPPPGLRKRGISRVAGLPPPSCLCIYKCISLFLRSRSRPGREPPAPGITPPLLPGSRRAPASASYRCRRRAGLPHLDWLPMALGFFLCLLACFYPPEPCVIWSRAHSTAARGTAV